MVVLVKVGKAKGEASHRASKVLSISSSVRACLEGISTETKTRYTSRTFLTIRRMRLYILFFSCFGAIPPRGVKVMPVLAGQRLYGFVNFMDEVNAEYAVAAMTVLHSLMA